jgi:recombination protein RecA
MSSAATLRHQIEAHLSSRIPAALTPAPRAMRPLAATGIPSVDQLLDGGLPVGALTEIVGRECSGRTSFALSCLARMTLKDTVCAWIDVSNTFDPESAAGTGIDLSRLLWVRCGAQPTSQAMPPAEPTFTLPEKYLAAPPVKQGLHGGGFGPHPRTEASGVSSAMAGLFHYEALAPRCAEPQRRVRPARQTFLPDVQSSPPPTVRSFSKPRPWTRMEQALRAADLLLQGGGFRGIVLDMGSIPPQAVARVPLATWFRYRAAAARTQSSILLLSQYPCAGSSAELVLQMQAGAPLRDEETVFSGLTHQVKVVRRRFADTPTNIVPMRKPPQRIDSAAWRSRTAWAGSR